MTVISWTDWLATRWRVEVWGRISIRVGLAVAAVAGGAGLGAQQGGKGRPDAAQWGSSPRSQAAALRGDLHAVPRDLRQWEAFERRAQRATARVLPAVVSCEGGGSGVLLPGGLVLTAAHVARRAGRRLRVVLRDGRRLTGMTLGLNHATDVALIRLDVPADAQLPAARLASTTRRLLGTWVLGLGENGGRKPFREPPVRLGRLSDAPGGGVWVSDCTLSSGDSGGPLFDLDGTVIAIHSKIGIGLDHNDHAPVGLVLRDWSQLLAGVTLGTPDGVDPVAIRDPSAGAFSAGSPLAGSPLAGPPLGGPPSGGRGRRAAAGHRRVEGSGDRHATGPVFDLPVDPPAPTVADWSSSFVAAAFRKDRPEVHRGLAEAVARARRSTVLMRSGGRPVALGTVVRSGRLIVSKASELGAGPVTGESWDGQVWSLTKVAESFANDLALLLVSGTKSTTVAGAAAERARRDVALPAVPWAGDALLPGPLSSRRPGVPGTGAEAGPWSRATVVVSPLACSPSPLALGLVSGVDARRGRGVRAADRRGTVGPREAYWGPLSAVRVGFAEVLQHDTVLRPDQCGGPLVNLRGEVLGVNISRAGRVESLALTGRLVRRLVDGWRPLRPSGAAGADRRR